MNLFRIGDPSYILAILWASCLVLLPVEKMHVSPFYSSCHRAKQWTGAINSKVVTWKHYRYHPSIPLRFTFGGALFALCQVRDDRYSSLPQSGALTNALRHVEAADRVRADSQKRISMYFVNNVFELVNILGLITPVCLLSSIFQAPDSTGIMYLT